MDSDNLALELLNTKRYLKGRTTDVIANPAQLHQWLARDTEPSPPVARLLFDQSRRLRDAIREAVEAHIRNEPVPPTSLYELNRALQVSRFTTQLSQDEHRLSLVERDTATPAGAALSRIALSAATLLTEVDPRRIRQCLSDRCVLWFLDTSKSGRRRWCSMATCGNRAKAARHYQRQKETVVD